jgi:hypothetical protein
VSGTLPVHNNKELSPLSVDEKKYRFGFIDDIDHFRHIFHLFLVDSDDDVPFHDAGHESKRSVLNF